jgi:hypothetical protein
VNLTHFYIFRKPCGCVVGGCPADPEFADRVADMIREGVAVDRVDATTAQTIALGQRCAEHFSPSLPAPTAKEAQ